VRRSIALFRAPVNRRNRFGEKYHASRFSNASHVANFRTIPSPRAHFRHFGEQIPQKESARDKNLQTRPSTLAIIPHSSDDVRRDIRLRQRLPVFTVGASDLPFLPSRAGRIGRVVPTLATFCGERGVGLPRVVVRVDLRTIAYSTRFFGLERTSVYVTYMLSAGCKTTLVSIQVPFQKHLCITYECF
jgi:hypothetical protein